MKWFTSLIPKYVRYPAFAIPIAVFVPLALFLPREKPDTSGDVNKAAATSSQVTTTIQDSPGADVVTSQGQSGGITAQTVIVDQTIINFFDDQPPDEREKWRQYLTEKYPLGWLILAADGTTLYTPSGLSYERDLELTWGETRVSKLTADYVYLDLPAIFVKPRGPRMSETNVDIRRKVGSSERTLWAGETAVDVEVLKDDGNFVVLAIGVRLEARKSSQSRRIGNLSARAAPLARGPLGSHLNYSLFIEARRMRTMSLACLGLSGDAVLNLLPKCVTHPRIPRLGCGGSSRWRWAW